MKIENLPQLEFLDDGFSYKGTGFTYEQIKGISFYAVHTRHSVNFVPTGNSYSAELNLHLDGQNLKIDQEWAYFGSSQKTRMEALWKAQDIFSDITFSSRLTGFEDELSQKNYFSYRNFHFHKTGDVFLIGVLLFYLQYCNFSI